MTNPTLERAARAVFDSEAQDDWDGSQLTWDEAPEEYRQHARRQARAVLMAVRELPEGFISQRRKLFESTEYLEYDFTTVLDEILNDEEQ